MKTIVVTGDSRGLGNKICDKLLESNFKVIGISRKISENILELEKNIEENSIYILILI